MPFLNGLRVACTLGGQRCSSTRAEIYGLYAGLHFEGPVHVGLDNAVAVGLANKMLKAAEEIEGGELAAWYELKLRSKPLGRRNLLLMKNGDLWSKVCAAILAKGSSSIKVTKVKGHATQEDIDQGKSNIHDKNGNDEADTVANLAVANHAPGMVSLTNWYAARHADYTKLVGRVQLFIIGMVRAHRQADEARLKESNPFGGKVQRHMPTRIRHGGDLRHRDEHMLNFRNCPTGTHKQQRRQQTMMEIRTFMQSLAMKEPPKEVAGISWVQLFILYELRGGSIDKDEQQREDEDQGVGKRARPKTSAENGLRIFKQIAKYIAANCLSEHDRKWWSSDVKGKPWRLQSFGCSADTASIAGLPVLTDMQAMRTAPAIVSTKTQLRGEREETWKHGSVGVM